MASTYYLTREDELAILEEVTYGTNPGGLTNAASFKHHAGPSYVTKSVARYERAMDADYQQASVLATPVQPGRVSSTVKIECDLVPAGSGAPTVPDVDLLLKNHFGQLHTCSANTTTTAGSAGTSIVLTGGGGATSGISVGGGDLVAIETASGTGNYEVRRVISRATDTLTIDRAMSTNPNTGCNVKVGTTWRFLNTFIGSLYMWRFLGGNDRKYAVPGLILNQLDIKYDASQNAPLGGITFAGPGMLETTQSDTRPTPATLGIPLVPTVGKIWLGAVRYCIVDIALSSKNGRDLRNNESCSLGPRAVYAKDRYNVTQNMSIYYTKQGGAGDEDADTLYAAAPLLGSIDALVQLGNVPGNIVAWETPAWKPDMEHKDINGLQGLSLSGRAYGTAGDDEIYLAYL